MQESVILAASDYCLLNQLKLHNSNCQYYICLNKVTDQIDRKWTVPSYATNFTAQYELVLSLTQENAYS